MHAVAVLVSLQNLSALLPDVMQTWQIGTQQGSASHLSHVSIGVLSAMLCLCLCPCRICQLSGSQAGHVSVLCSTRCFSVSSRKCCQAGTCQMRLS